MKKHADSYASIREIVGEVIGKRVIDVTQQDRDEFDENGKSYVMIMFEGGLYLKFPVGDDGFEHSCGDSE